MVTTFPIPVSLATVNEMCWLTLEELGKHGGFEVHGVPKTVIEYVLPD